MSEAQRRFHRTRCMPRWVASRIAPRRSISTPNSVVMRRMSWRSASAWAQPRPVIATAHRPGTTTSASRCMRRASAACCKLIEDPRNHQSARDPARRGGGGARHDPIRIAGRHAYLFPRSLAKEAPPQAAPGAARVRQADRQRGFAPPATCTAPPTGRTMPSRCWRCSVPSRACATPPPASQRARSIGRKPSSRRAACAWATVSGTWFSAASTRHELHRASALAGRLPALLHPRLPRRPEPAGLVADTALRPDRRAGPGAAAAAMACPRDVLRLRLGGARRLSADREQELGEHPRLPRRGAGRACSGVGDRAHRHVVRRRLGRRPCSRHRTRSFSAASSPCCCGR
jgi:hypothetical protein